MKVYLAGPDVFRLDVTAWAESCRTLCVERGLVALLPGDSSETTAAGIDGVGPLSARKRPTPCSRMALYRWLLSVRSGWAMAHSKVVAHSNVPYCPLGV